MSLSVQDIIYKDILKSQNGLTESWVRNNYKKKFISAPLTMLVLLVISILADRVSYWSKIVPYNNVFLLLFYKHCIHI